MLIVEPGVQPVVEKSNNPNGKATPAGAVPAGGLAASPVNGMNRGPTNAHVSPPPVKLAAMLPALVGELPVYVLNVGVTVAIADAAPLPTALVATTEQLNVVPVVRPVTTSGEAAPVADKAPGVQLAV